MYSYVILKGLLIVNTSFALYHIHSCRPKVGRAAKDTREASNRIVDLLDDVENIMSELQNSPEISEKELDRLEEQIRVTEERLKEAKLDEKLESLKQEHRMQDELIDQYKNQIYVLEKEANGELDENIFKTAVLPIIPEVTINFLILIVREKEEIERE
ncbi:hypothetical protein NQ318_023167 [Aromia moschata]|uniref:Uncharacterized protein n=1 Tax=Aromia moschata TaxID=1265417 RepID=A0AAV8X8A2_9CUCU|nr:hypothetical protein NQ318_023167 [Aromia moschata]